MPFDNPQKGVNLSHDEDDFYEEINDPKIINPIWASFEALKREKSTYGLTELKLMLIEEWVHREDQNQASIVDKKIFSSSFKKAEIKKILEFIALRP